MMGVYPDGAAVERRASITDPYRWSLWRQWGSAPSVATFVMLNPSTADGEQDDPTIRRCVGFARALGCESLLVVNLYAYRATKPADLWRAEVDPTGGQRNDDILQEVALGAQARQDPLIAAWGAHARADRVQQVLRLRGFDRLTTLGVTKAGAPRHPLYLPAAAVPVPWVGVGDGGRPTHA